MTTLGAGEYRYRVSGKDWGNLPAGWGYGSEVTAVAVDARDNLYVFSRGERQVVVLDPNGDVLRTWGEERMFDNPHGALIGPDGSVYVVDKGEHVVQKFTPEGELLMTIGSRGRPSPPMSGEPFSFPTHVALDPVTGDLYVSDGYSNARVHKYSPDGNHLFSWGESGTDPGQFNLVHNIATDRDGWVYVADRQNKRIQIFDSTGRYETQWVNLARANCVCLDRTGDGLVYVAELYSGVATNVTGMRIGPRITVFDRQGNVKARLGEHSFGAAPGRFYAPHGMAADSRGNIYLAESSLSETGHDRYGGTVDRSQELRSLQKLVRVGEGAHHPTGPEGA